MNTPRALILLTIGTASILITLGCKNNGTTAQAGGRPAMAGKDALVLNVSKADQEALNTVLSRYNKALYKIEIYKNGHLERTLGQLSEDVIGKAIVREIATNAKVNSLSGWAVRLGPYDLKNGLMSGISTRPSGPLPPPLKRSLVAQSSELVRRVEPTLAKYGGGNVQAER